MKHAKTSLQWREKLGRETAPGITARMVVDMDGAPRVATRTQKCVRYMRFHGYWCSLGASETRILDACATRLRDGLLLNDPLSDGIKGPPRQAVQVKLLKNVAAMRIHGIDVEVKDVRHLLVGPTLRQKLQDFPLTWS